MIGIGRDRRPGERSLARRPEPGCLDARGPLGVGFIPFESVEKRPVQLVSKHLGIHLLGSWESEFRDVVDRPGTIAGRIRAHQPVDPAVGVDPVPERDAANVVGDDVEPIELELLDEPGEHLFLGADRTIEALPSVAIPVADEIRHDRSELLFQLWGDLPPEERSGRDPVEEENGFTGSFVAAGDVQLLAVDDDGRSLLGFAPAFVIHVIPGMVGPSIGSSAMSSPAPFRSPFAGIGTAFSRADECVVMETVTIEEIEASEMGEADVRNVADALGTTDLAMNRFRLEPGGSFTSGMHAHLDQEEVFYVIEGTATFETPEGTHEIEAGEAVRFAPGEYQQGRNESDAELSALALGAPKESTELRVPTDCPECEESDAMAVNMGEEGMTLECPECGAEMGAPA